MKELRRPIFSIGVAASLVGLAPTTIRGWVRAGYVAPVRAANGWRMFSWQDVELLRRVRDLSRRGLSSQEIRRRLRRQAGRPGSPLEGATGAASLPAVRRLSRRLERGRQAILAIPAAVRPA
ncbi:MAG TPA: MerR family transcriptional regulator [bacterium]|jgi:DNA-binding transcriptional MerR regulator|nr:MerR family transcriptional regulator [bacterium]